MLPMLKRSAARVSGRRIRAWNRGRCAEARLNEGIESLNHLYEDLGQATGSGQVA
jgi:hypothetical protein